MSIDALHAKIRKLKNPTLILFAPTEDLIPPALLERHAQTGGKTPEAVCAAVGELCTGVLEQMKGLVPAVGFQADCFLAMGWQGVALLQQLLEKSKHLGFYVLLDGQFSDVGRASETMAKAVFGAGDGEAFLPAAYHCDAVTLNAYQGSDSIKPYLPYLQGENPKNIFVCIKSSNRSAREVQDLISGDRVVHTALADMTMRWSLDLFGRNGYGEVCAVVSATNALALQQLRRKYDQLFFLIKGIEDPGGTVRSASHGFNRMGHGALICAGPSILGAWKNTGGACEDFRAAARAAAEKLKAQIEDYVTVL